MLQTEAEGEKKILKASLKRKGLMGSRGINEELISEQRSANAKLEQ